MVLKRLEEMMKYEDNSDDSSLSLEVLWSVVNESCVFAAAPLKSDSRIHGLPQSVSSSALR